MLPFPSNPHVAAPPVVAPRPAPPLTEPQATPPTATPPSADVGGVNQGDDAERARIAAEALWLFQSYGFRRVRMADVATRLGMSKKTLYRHFDSKEALIADVLDRVADPWLRRADEVLDAGVAFAEGALELAGFIETLSRSISRSMLDDMVLLPHVWRLVEAKRVHAVVCLSRLLEAGKREGTVRADLDIRLFTDILISTLNTFGTPRTLLERDLPVGEFARQVFTLFTAGILATPGGAPLQLFETALERGQTEQPVGLEPADRDACARAGKVDA